mgnify:CR=1 FL=1|jgi:hypothetical protein
MNSFKKFSSALTLSGLCMGLAYAAEPAGVAKVTEANGKVLVNKGNGLVSTKAGAPLVDGDRIVTLDKSNARVIFSDGCELVLEENKILVIDMKLGCKAAVLASEPAVGAVAAGESLPAGLWIGGIAVAGGALLVGANSNNKNNPDNRPISGQ